MTDGNIVTANGSGYLEFTRELLKLLENDTPEMIDGWYTFNKEGLVKLCTPQPHFKFATNTKTLFTMEQLLYFPQRQNLGASALAMWPTQTEI